MARRSPRSRRTREIALNLTSMIDLTFLLLIYFMVTTVIAAPEVCRLRSKPMRSAGCTFQAASSSAAPTTRPSRASPPRSRPRVTRASTR